MHCNYICLFEKSTITPTKHKMEMNTYALFNKHIKLVRLVTSYEKRKTISPEGGDIVTY